MTEVSMVGIARLAGKLWVEKATATATTTLSKALTSIWPAEEYCGCAQPLTGVNVCDCMNMKHGVDGTDQTFNMYNTRQNLIFY